MLHVTRAGDNAEQPSVQDLVGDTAVRRCGVPDHLASVPIGWDDRASEEAYLAHLADSERCRLAAQAAERVTVPGDDGDDDGPKPRPTLKGVRGEQVWGHPVGVTSAMLEAKINRKFYKACQAIAMCMDQRQLENEITRLWGESLPSLLTRRLAYENEWCTRQLHRRFGNCKLAKAPPAPADADAA
jgi:hypothetical protein